MLCVITVEQNSAVLVLLINVPKEDGFRLCIRLQYRSFHSLQYTLAESREFQHLALT